MTVSRGDEAVGLLAWHANERTCTDNTHAHEKLYKGAATKRFVSDARMERVSRYAAWSNGKVAGRCQHIVM